MAIKDSQVSFNLSVGTPIDGKSPVWCEGEEETPPLFWVENVDPNAICRATAYCVQYGEFVSASSTSTGDILERYLCWLDSPAITGWGLEVHPLNEHEKIVIPENLEGILSEKFQSYIRS